jgi:hypothetical protein
VERNETHIYRVLVLAHSYRAKECLRKIAAGCVAALGLTVPDSLWTQWYTLPEMQRLVTDEWAPQGVRDIRRDECLRLNLRSSCVAFLRQHSGVKLPLSKGARLSFLIHVLKRGGAGAYARLTSGTTDLPTRLAKAGGAPLETLAAEWRADLDKARPDVHAGSTATRASTVFWVFLFAALAMRSTRCRLG